MRRREFISKGAAAALILPTFVIQACETRPPNETNSGSPDSVKERFSFDEITIDELQSQMTQGKISARGIVEKYLNRIAEIDKDGPHLNSIIELNPDALSIADQMDEERKSGEVRGALHGIPFLLKDNIDTADKMMTTAGSLALEGHRAQSDAPVVKQLRDAGAVLMGKTNLSEWANFRSSRSSSGWSSRGGQTKNPYHINRNPCGSSSGSGVAVAANLCAFAIGTETNGSIACPASINGIVGIKPTVGLVSRTGIIPISITQDTAGPMTRTIRDAALVMNAITARDEHDKATTMRPATLIEDYTSVLQADALAGKRIGVEKSFLKVHEGVDRILETALQQLKSKGATILEVNLVERLKPIGEHEYNVLQYEFKDGLNRYLANVNGETKSLKDVIAFNTAHADRSMPYFQQDILESSEQKASLDTKEYQTSLNKVLSISRSAIDNLMDEHKLDCIIGPAYGPAWCTDLINGDAFSGYGMSSGPAMAGYPSITVPLGDVHGLPVGLLFLAKAFQEAELLAIAYAYEQISKNRQAPDFSKGLS